MRCAARVDVGTNTIVVGFAANETLDPTMWPGGLALEGMAMQLAASPTMVGRTVDSCVVRVTEGTHQAVGQCGRECTVTIVNYYPAAGTLWGTIRCGAMADDSTPPVYRTLQQGDGVPNMSADFSLRDCVPAP